MEREEIINLRVGTQIMFNLFAQTKNIRQIMDFLKSTMYLNEQLRLRDCN